MARLSVFNFLTLNGHYKGLNEDISWHKHGEEEGEFSAKGVQSDSILLFGRVTYEMMAGFWPTPMALETMPIVADGMNKSEKIVFSKTLKKANWKNTQIISSNMIEAVKKLKQTSAKDLTILGSGSIVTQLAEHGLIDVYQFMIDPVAIGAGNPLFQNVGRQLDFRLTNTQIFKSGIVLLCYEPQN